MKTLEFDFLTKKKGCLDKEIGPVEGSRQVGIKRRRNTENTHSLFC